MFRATLRSLLSRKFRLILTSISIVLGVSFVSSAFILTDSLSGRFDTLFQSVNSNINVQVRGTKISADAPDSDLGDGRKTMPVALLDTVRGVDGVKSATGGVTGQAVLVGKNGKAISSFGPPAIGDSWDPDDDLNSLHITSGRAPTAPDEVLLTAFSADKADVDVGQPVRIVTGTGITTFTVVGIAKYSGDRDSLAGETYAAFTLAEAQTVFAVPDGLTYIQVHAQPGVSNATLRDRVAAVTGPNTQVLTNAQLNAEQAGDVQKGLSFFKTFLLVFAGVALFVGAFIIANTFSILVAQRTRELALLRALGASKGQVTRSVLAEALAVGLISSIIGLGGGVALAYGLQALFGAVGADFPDGATKIELRTVIVALLVGVGVTCAAALFPSRKAARVAPVAAMREAAAPDRPLRKQVIIGAVLAVAGGVAMFLGLTGSPLLILGLGVLLVFLGVAILSPALSRPVVAVLGAPFRRGMPGRLGRDNAARNPRRTASTAAALMIGLALVGAIGVIGSSAKASISGLVKDTGQDFIIQSSIQAGAASALPTDIVQTVSSVPGVKTVGALAFDSIRFGPDSVKASAGTANDEALTGALNLERVSGKVDTVPDGSFLSSKTFAKDHDLKLGSSDTVVYATGQSSTLTLAGIYKDNALAEDIAVPQSDKARFLIPKDIVVFVEKSDGASASSVRAGLDKALADQPTVDVQDQTEFTDQVTSQINGLMTVLQLFLVLAIIVAAIGIVNTLALSVLERTRELGLLRAIGMTRRQVKRMVRVESVIIAVFGALLGVVVGVGFGIALQRALSDQGIGTLALPWVQLIVYVLLAGVIGVLAALMPARRASRLNVLDAIKAD
jgi:putative ABC transport system permease protein